MRMSHLASIAFACSISLFSAASFAQSPADDDPCDELTGTGKTPSLYGLCVAYWATEDNSNSDASSKILAKYNERKEPGDPEMPGLTPCLCWTAADLAIWKQNLTVSANTCFIDDYNGVSDGFVVWNNSENGDGVDVQTYKYSEVGDVPIQGSCQAVINNDVTSGDPVHVSPTPLGKNSSETCHRELVTFCDSFNGFDN